MCFDTPYNLLDYPWDHQITQQELVNIMSQFAVSQRTHNNPCVVAMYHKPRDTDIVMSAMEDCQYQEFEHIFWYKTESHSAPTPVKSYTNSVEMMTLGFFPAKNKCHWNVPKDPRHRHNLLVAKSPEYVKERNGQVLNQSQKPRELMKEIVVNHVPMGGHVLVVGAGAGGDVLGALNAQVNVVAVESDGHQFNFLKTTLDKELTLATEETDVKASEADEKAGTDPSKEGEAAVSTQQKQGAQSGIGSVAAAKCIDCGSTNAPAGDLKRECVECDIKGPLCADCSIQVPGSEDWLCHDHTPPDMAATQEE